MLELFLIVAIYRVKRSSLPLLLTLSLSARDSLTLGDGVPSTSTSFMQASRLSNKFPHARTYMRQSWPVGSSAFVLPPSPTWLFQFLRASVSSSAVLHARRKIDYDGRNWRSDHDAAVIRTVAHHSSRIDRTRVGKLKGMRFVHGRREGGDDRGSFTTGNNTITRACIAVGSNLGDRFGNVKSALSLLSDEGDDCSGVNDGGDDVGFVTVRRTSHLYETAPMYLTDQPAFLNGAIEIETNLNPPALLDRLKLVERIVGRKEEGAAGAIRYGPRPIDLDVLFYGDDDEIVVRCESPPLHVPHPRIQEREFVLLPLCDLNKDAVHPTLNQTVDALREQLRRKEEEEQGVGAERQAAAVRVIPLPRERMLCLNETVVMGVLNVTPDSFSDGGKLKGSVEAASDVALQMEQDGAGIIDIGGESTRPGAKEIEVEEELRRTIPVITELRRASDIPISIDTRHAAVARAAVEAGADIVNDVSGGTFDPNMLSTVASLHVPVVLMHMRGTPETMLCMADYGDRGGVVPAVAASLLERSAEAERAGVPRWLQILDPGIGFAKDLDGNLSLLKHVGELRAALGDATLLVGPSRKGFIGKITGTTRPADRDFGTAAACVAAISDGGCNIVRVHNVKGIKQAVRMMDAIKRAT